MDDRDIRGQINRGLAWVGLASSFVWVLDIVAYILIFKLWISVDDYGVAIVAISLYPVLDLASELGLNSAIVQRDDHTDARISTIFWLNLMISVALAALLVFGIGPLIAWIHEHPVAGLMLSTYGAKLLWQNVYIVPQALMRKQMRFKELSAIRSVANVGEFAAKVGFAAAGAGIWCFVAGPLCRQLISGIGIQMRHPWRPKMMFRLGETLHWVKYGVKQSLSQIVYHAYTNADYQIVGHYFSDFAAGLYGAAYELVIKPCYLIAQTLQGVAFPAYSRLKLAREKLTDQFFAFTRLSVVMILGFLAVVATSAPEILEVFYRPSWVGAADAARVLCVVGLLRAMSFAITPLLDGVGRPGLNLTYNLIAAVTMPALFFGFAELSGDRLGHLSVAYAWAFGYPVAFAALLIMALRVLEVGMQRYIKAVWSLLVIAAAAIAAGTVTRTLLWGLPPGARFVVSTVVVLAVLLLFLAYWQGISYRSVRRALSAKPPTSEEDEVRLRI